MYKIIHAYRYENLFERAYGYWIILKDNPSFCPWTLFYFYSQKKSLKKKLVDLLYIYIIQFYYQLLIILFPT